MLPSDVGGFGSKFVANISGLKAAELRLFFLSVALAVLDSDFLSAKELAMLETFVTACRLIDVVAITVDQAREAHKLFGTFVRQFARLYGQDRVTPNMHYHAHLCECIIDHGPLHSMWGFVWEQLTGLVVNPSTNGRQVNVQFCKAWDLQDRVRIPDAYFDCAKEMSSDERKLLVRLADTVPTKPATLPRGFDLAAALSFPIVKYCNGTEPLLVYLRHPSQVELPELERRGLVTALGSLYPDLCDADGKFKPPVAAEVTSSPTADVIGERFGTIGSRNERSSFVVAWFAGELQAGRLLRIVQFPLNLPRARAGQPDEKDEKKQQAVGVQQVPHTFVQVRWFRPHRDHKLVPEFKLDNPYDNLALQWLPLHRIACRVAPRFTARGATRTLIACLLPRKPVLFVPIDR